MRVNCAVLLLLAQYTVDKAKADPPATYTWQIERIQLGEIGGLVQGLQPGDLIVANIDVSLGLFPLVVRSIQVACSVPPDQYHDPLRVIPIIYDAWGIPRYYSNQEAVILPWGFNEIPLTEMHDPSSGLDGPVVLDHWDGWSMDASGLYIGLLIIGLLEDEGMTAQSPTLVCAPDGLFPSYNLMQRWSAELQDWQWAYLGDMGLPGNMAIRAVVEPFCPALIGDIDGDTDIDETDLEYLATAIQQGGDIFLDSRRYMDLNNDWVLDNADVEIQAAHFTGPDQYVVAPRIDILTSDLRRTFPVGYLVPDDTVFEVRNKGAVYWFFQVYDGPSGVAYPPLNFQVTTDAPWLTVLQTSGVSTGGIQQIPIHFATESLGTGEYQATIRIDGNAGNSPQIGHVTVVVQTTGDFDLDGDVDGDDLDVFNACETGPSIPYAIDVPPPDCEMTRDAQGFLLGDLDRDRDIDQDDFGLLQARIGLGPNAIAQAMSSMRLPPTAPVATPSSTPPWWDAHLVLPDPTQPLATPQIPWIAVGLVILVLVLIFIGWGFWGFVQDAKFMNAGSRPDSVEAGHIRLAINYLDELARNVPGAHADIREAYQKLQADPWMHADTCGCEVLLLINRKPVGDKGPDGKVIDESGEEKWAAKCAGLACKICLRRDLVVKDNWNDFDTARLAMALLAEWEHHKYGPSEKTCQHHLEETVRTVEEYMRVGIHQLHYQHGVGEKGE